MADIIHEFSVKSPQEMVYEMFTTPGGLDRWWTKESSGEAKLGATYRLYFGPGYDWRAKVTECAPGLAFELQMTDAHEDWVGTKVGCKLSKEGQAGTRVFFYHTGWPTGNEHWRLSNFCWAMYLRILRRSLEYGDFVPYEKRLDV
jgi:uncharacterized protein YndB with AHSA1/START domain